MSCHVVLDITLTPCSGYGIGTTPTALDAHGIATTIVEIDPVVYKLGMKWFSHPKHHTAVLEDAVTWVHREQAKVLASVALSAYQKFDYIVHDVFTGGAEPVELFTVEFIQGLSDLLADDGKIAIVRACQPPQNYRIEMSVETDRFTELCRRSPAFSCPHHTNHSIFCLSFLSCLPRVTAIGHTRVFGLYELNYLLPQNYLSIPFS